MSDIKVHILLIIAALPDSHTKADGDAVCKISHDFGSGFSHVGSEVSEFTWVRRIQCEST